MLSIIAWISFVFGVVIAPDKLPSVGLENPGGQRTGWEDAMLFDISEMMIPPS